MEKITNKIIYYSRIIINSWKDVAISTVGRWKDMGLEVSLETWEWSDRMKEVVAVYLILATDLAIAEGYPFQKSIN
jgi:hypothetical protein